MSKRSSSTEGASLRSPRGGGLLKNITRPIRRAVGKLLAPRQDFSPADKAILDAKKDQKIVEIKIVRTPLSSAVQILLQIAGGARFKQAIPYDQLFHLFLIIFLEDGTKLLYEKNETPRLTTDIAGNKEMSKDSKALVVPVDKPITLGEFVSKAQASMGPDFFSYTPFRLNCQDHIARSLQANSLLTEEDRQFILQDLTEASKTISPLVKGVAQGAINLASFVRKITGRGFDNRSGKFIKVKKVKAKGKAKTLRKGRVQGGSLEDPNVSDIPNLSDEQLAQIINASGRSTTAQTVAMDPNRPPLDPKIVRQADENLARRAISERGSRKAQVDRADSFAEKEVDSYNSTIEAFGDNAEEIWSPLVYNTVMMYENIERQTGEADPVHRGYIQAMADLRREVPEPERPSTFDQIVSGFTAPFRLAAEVAPLFL